MSSSPLSEGFTVVCIEGKWYPLEVQRLYSSAYPNGFVALYPFYDLDGNDVYYRTKKEAVADCQVQARISNDMQRHVWERLVEDFELYPERNAWHMTLIEQIMGHAPIIGRRSDGYAVYAVGSTCKDCGEYVRGGYVEASTLDEVLEKAAQEAYSVQCLCERIIEQRLQHVTYWSRRETKALVALL